MEFMSVSSPVIPTAFPTLAEKDLQLRNFLTGSLPAPIV
jgi:hypothetical protein